MNQGMMMQSIMWVLAFGVLLLYMQRRRKRKSNS
jgi:hypothetical protein